MKYEERLIAAAKLVISADEAPVGPGRPEIPSDPAEFGVTAELKPHQVEGLAWLVRRYLLGVNVVLGDEVRIECLRVFEQMGLGKTLQAISLLGYLKTRLMNPGPYLVLCPLSVTEGWVSEFAKFCPVLRILKYVGDKGFRRDLRRSVFEHVKQQCPPSNGQSVLPFDVLLTTYDLALLDQDFLSQIPWQYAVIDEAQRVKNPDSPPYLVSANEQRRELPELLALSSGTSSRWSLQNIVIQLRKACSHPYLFNGIEPEPYEEGEHLVQASGKLVVLDQLLRRLHASGHRVLLFAQMTHTLDILQDYLELRKYSYERLDGSVRAEERFAAIRSFSKQSDEGRLKLKSLDGQNSAFVFMISTRAGGVGLNLVAADTVIFYEQDWNPQVDKQALQRAHRIGQMCHVLAINLVTARTVEEVIMRRAERKLQLSHDVIDEDNVHKEGKEVKADAGDLRSLIVGLHKLDPTGMNPESSNGVDVAELDAMVQKVIEMRNHLSSGKDDQKFEINPVEFTNYGELIMRKSSASINSDPILDEASFLAWVEKFKEASQTIESHTLELGKRRHLPEEKQQKEEAERKKIKLEERKKAKWEALGYQSLAVKEPAGVVNDDLMSDSGSVQFVFGDCTNPSKLCPSEPAVIFSCVDNSGNWGHGGMFSALENLSTSIPDAYQQAFECGDLHLGDVHLIKLDVSHDNDKKVATNPLWVALAVVQSYNPRRKVPRSNILMDDLERCLSKTSFSASQNSASIHMPRIGYQDGSGRSEWYTIERLLRKYASIYGISIYV
ncbi:putative chromatin-remodeling complex ATPase chain [Acorus calamus]|uniref:Chromatin-remodeling complex ATPase chain n=1 Tax=Acorus calamus TaxID=4465 RepID=A0AAV9E1E0_ACOCL|nr:putative chromatin-remodeling complex ATPase chain [Acorus calamus]